MFGPESILFFFGLLTLAVMFQPVVVKFGIPYAVILVLLGFLGSEFITKTYSIDTGVRWDNVKPLVFNIFIPIIIFSAAIKIDLKNLWSNSIWIFILAIPLTLLGILLVAGLLYLGIGHPVGFPWEVALLCAVLISATDPSTLPTIFKQAGIAKRVNILLEGESLFNDALAVVLFSLLLALLSHQLVHISYLSSVNTFVMIFFGGIFAGLIAGGLLVLIVRLIDDVYLRTLFTLLASYGVYIIADRQLQASGVMAVLTTGLMLGHFANDVFRKDVFTNRFWEFAERITYIMVFLLAGITITLGMFAERWLAMLIGIFAALGVRALIFFILVPLMALLPKAQKFSISERCLLTWGGVRGTVTLALALSLPIDIPAWYTVQSIAYGVVLFNLFVHVTTMPLLLKRCMA